MPPISRPEPLLVNHPLDFPQAGELYPSIRRLLALRPGGEDGVEFRMRRRPLGEAERALCLHLACRGEEACKSRAGEGAADTDALDAELVEIFDGEPDSLHAHQDIDGLVDFLEDSLDVLPARQSRRIEHIGTRI